MKKQFDIDEVIENGTKILVALKTIIKCGEVILDNLNTYREVTSELNVVEAPKQIEAKESEATEKPTLSFEQVRAILSAKSNADNGAYRTDIKALVKKYSNGGVLKDVNPDDFESLVNEVEGL